MASTKAIVAKTVEVLQPLRQRPHLSRISFVSSLFYFGDVDLTCFFIGNKAEESRRKE